ncbi:MAG: Maf family protein [Candidatus Obscuribacterales bacterium]|nr:Maf family protein [Candidatus Obscuribacterales bacterium]
MSKLYAASYKVILASASPRRVDLLAKLGIIFETHPSLIEEKIDPSLTPSETVVDLARQKASHVLADLSKVEDNLIVIGADTIVVIDDRLLGKPEGYDDAASMLELLSGRSHEVYTGVSIMCQTNRQAGLVLMDYEVSTIHFRRLARAEIDAYIASGEPMDKAGAYALQGAGAAFVSKLEGCYTNVIGLPIPLTISLLRQTGLNILGTTEI